MEVAAVARIKRLSFRAAGSPSHEAVADHFAGFEFEGGPWQVIYKGVWGQVQVWAISAEEGRRVIEHVAAVAGWGQQEMAEGQWLVAEVSSSRMGKPGRFRVRVRDGVLMVLERPTPSGTASGVLAGS